MVEPMVAAAHPYELPSFCPEPPDNLLTVHVYILHNIREDIKGFGHELGKLVRVAPNSRAHGWTPQVAINLAQWLSPAFAVQVSKWVLDWSRGKLQGYMPVHVRRFMKNRSKIDCVAVRSTCVQLVVNLR